MLFDFLNEYYTTYINDIFIYNQLKKEYEKYIKQIFIKLKKNRFTNRYKEIRILDNIY